MKKRSEPLPEPVVLRRRCAIYTRKSSDEGLEQEFNSLDAQREACEAYIVSQRREGWDLVPDRYDDGGIFGGTLDRPAMRRLMADIKHGRVDIVVVYKIDRLTRSLADFAELVALFDANEVVFVSITQSFNTTTSMGRLTLNILLSFAQYERELTGERIRDKFAASRKKGIWMGGCVPLGYRVDSRKLVPEKVEVAIVHKIFEGYAKTQSAMTVARDLASEGTATRSGKPFTVGLLYKLLHNRVYLGLAVHKGVAYPGEHPAIISQALWDSVHAVLGKDTQFRSGSTRRATPSLLKGLVFDAEGAAMSPTHCRTRGRLYRYYTSQSLIKRGRGTVEVGRVPAAELEAAVIGQIRALLCSPEVIVATWRTGRDKSGGLTEADVREALSQLAPMWDELFPAEQARIAQLLIQRIDVGPKGADIRFRAEGIHSLASEFMRPERAGEALS